VLMADRDIALTPKEFDLLACLAEDPGRALTRQEILERAWGAIGTVRARCSTFTSPRCDASWVILP